MTLEHWLIAILFALVASQQVLLHLNRKAFNMLLDLLDKIINDLVAIKDKSK